MRRIIAAGGGVGWLPRRWWGSDRGAGTFGAVLAGALSLALHPAGIWWQAAAALAAVAASLWASRPFSAGDEDPGWIVIDEIAGTLVALIGLSGWAWAVAWGVARLADIYKVLPGVGAAERLGGARGVTGDDVVAGGYGLAAGWLLTAFL